MPRVVAFGELLIDFTMQALDQDNYPTMKAHPGGAPGNYLAALSAYAFQPDCSPRSEMMPLEVV